MRFSLAQAGGLRKIDLLAEAGAGVPTGIADQLPTDGRGTLAVVVEVLLRLVGVMSIHLRLEIPGRRYVIHSPQHGPGDPLEGLKGRAGVQAFDRIRDRKSTRLNSSHSQISYAV